MEFEIKDGPLDLQTAEEFGHFHLLCGYACNIHDKWFLGGTGGQFALALCTQLSFNIYSGRRKIQQITRSVESL